MKRALFAAATLAMVIVLALSVNTGTAQEGEAKYVGPDACNKCHFKEHRYWKKTKLITAFDVLKPTAEDADKELFDRKTAAKLDPAKDYSTDAKCVKCHTTGHGKPGGYPADPSADEATAKLMAGISCEACHGPGSKYVEHKTKALEADKAAKFTFDDLAPMGLVKPDATNCKTCHNDQNPTNATDAFKYDEAKAGVHSKKKK